MSTASFNSRFENSLSTSLQRWLLGLVLCCGGAIVWAVMLSWSAEWATWWFNREHLFESRTVALRTNGEPYVITSRYSRDGLVRTDEYKTVDGQTIVLEQDELNQKPKTWQATLFSTIFASWPVWSGQQHQWIDAPEPLPWLQSLLHFVEGHQYTGGRQWYFRWPRHAGGTGYFEGYDLKTKHRIGFIGLNGFSETVPAAVDQFPAWDSSKTATAVLVSQGNGGHFPPNSMTIVMNEPGESPEHGLWFITPKRDRLFVINLTRRSVVAKRVLTEKLLGISVQQESSGNSQLETHALLWTDRLEIVSPTLETQREIHFPTERHGKVTTFSELPSGEFEASHIDPSSQPGVIPADQHFVRFNDKGEVTLRRTVTVPLAKPSEYWSADQNLAPLSLMPIGLAGWLAPYWSGNFYEQGDQGLKPFRHPDEPLTWSLRLKILRWFIRMHSGSVPFWLTLLSGLPFAALCVWRQRALPATRIDRIAWPLLLSVFGIVGWVAFRTHRRWPSCMVSDKKPSATQLAAA